jgi:putative membrane-bound dehydrogenase-like protein
MSPLRLLFLGDQAGHQPAMRYQIIRPVLAARGIHVDYADTLDVLRPETLARYDGLIIYANYSHISPEQEKALLDYVASGKGLVALHCASYCFLNSPRYIALVGAQFRSHGSGVFRPVVVEPNHPIMRNYDSFSSWDETYIHTKHNHEGRTVLEVRSDGEVKEPWTWVRQHGRGRVFYTAWGHDQRTWSHPGFHNLLERGIRWVCNQDPAAAGAYRDKPSSTKLPQGPEPFEYVPAKVPFYPPSKVWGKQAEPLSKMQKPLPVTLSRQRMVVPQGFEVRLFASEELLGGKPLAMAWDERGRLYVAITVDYPNELQPAGKGRDRIVVCEDTDGDGQADRVTVFADRLSIPTSLLPFRGGLIVHQPPHTLFLKDTDGDGRADRRDILLSGWGTNDTHAGPSNLRYGFDNWIYGAVGYAGFNGVVAGQVQRFRQGFYRFRVGVEGSGKQERCVVTALEFLRSTSNNTWGLNFDEWGRLFGSTANGCPIVHMPIPNRYYEKVRGLSPTILANIAPDYHFEPITDKVRQVDWHGGFTAASHIALYTARSYPPEYWNRAAFVSDPTGHLTATFVVQDHGSTVRARYGWNLVASDDEWCAPIDAQVGPDGQVWIIDWYNFIVQHNPTPAGYRTGRGNAYETDLRDKKHGRIYRIVYAASSREHPPQLDAGEPSQWLTALGHPNLTWRLHAQRLLLERNRTDAIPALCARVTQRGFAPLHALWVLHGLGCVDGQNSLVLETVMAALRHPQTEVRAAAWQVLPRDPQWLSRLQRPLIEEAYPFVQLQALLALSDFPPHSQAARMLVEAWKSWPFHDAEMQTAWTIAAATHDQFVLAALADLPASPETQAVVERIAYHWAAHGDGAQLLSLLRAATKAAPELAESLVAGIAAGWPRAKTLTLPADSGTLITTLLGRLSADGRGRLIKLATTWGVAGLENQLRELAQAAQKTLADMQSSDAERTAAARLLVELQPQDDSVVRVILAAVTPQASPILADGLLDALRRTQASTLGSALVASLKTWPPASRNRVVALILERPEALRALLDAVEKGEARFDWLALDQRVALTAHPDRTIAARARKLLELGGGLPNPDRQKVIDELKPIVLSKQGDIVRGKKVFTQHCSKCHQHSGEGTALGPDLTGFAVHPKEEILIHVLDPSRSVEGNFKAYRVQTNDERTLLGIIGAQTANTVEVIDGEAKRHVLTKDEITSLVETDKSLMPEGFEKVMSIQELVDLIEFLTHKGKYVPLPLDRVATVISTKDMFFDRGGTAERLIFPDWKPKYFEGVPFVLVDPRNDTVKNVVMLYGPQGVIPPQMPRRVNLPYAGQAQAIHLLSGIGGWAAQRPIPDGSVSMIVRLYYADGSTEDHALRNGVHFADYIGRFDVPGSKFAFALRNQQVRYLRIPVKRPEAPLQSIEFIKGPDRTAPIVVAVTVETP